MAEAKRTSIFSVASLAGSPVKRPASLATREDPSRSAAKRATPPGAAAAAPKHQAPPHDERVRVFVRVRPNRPDETPGALALHPGGAALQARRDEFSAVDFSFDRVLGPSASQADCYQAAAAPIVADVLRGYNATLLAYGQTGSGKTHTLGSFRPDAVGMIPRACAQVFAALAAEPEGGHTVHLAYLQIYCEQIQDLLRPGSGDSLPIREGEGGVCVPGLRQEEVASLEDCLRLLQLGDRNRSVAFTALNACSSRSHAVVQLTVARRGGGGGAAAQRVRVGKLYMVDLAGSERLKKSRSTGQRASEAKAINLSLTALGMCVNARADPAATHVPFRDSKLTRLLQESLGGNARTSLVVAVSDAREHGEETVQSLAFGTRAMRVSTKARVNERVDAGQGGPGAAALRAALRGVGGRSEALERSLADREGALEEVQEQLKAERQRSAQVVAALQRERHGAEARAHALIQQHASLMQQEEEQRAGLQERLRAVEARAGELQQGRDLQAAQAAAALDEERSAAAAAREEAEAQARSFSEQLETLALQRRADVERLQQAHAAETAAAAARHAAAVDAARHEAHALARKVAQLEEQRRLDADEHSAALGVVDAAWEERLRRAADDGERRQREAAAVAAGREREIVALRAALADRNAKVAQARGVAQRLDAALAQARAAVEAARGRAAAEAARAARAEANAEEQLRARVAMASTLLRHKRVNDAARAIQRAFRAHRLRALRRQRSEGFAALHEAQHALGSMVEQHAELERRRHANLAFAGQTLVADSLGVLSEAVEALVSTFLLPAKDLKTLRKYRNASGKVGGGALVAPLAALSTADGVLFPPAAPPAARDAAGLIRAFTPPAPAGAGPLAASARK